MSARRRRGRTGLSEDVQRARENEFVVVLDRRECQVFPWARGVPRPPGRAPRCCSGGPPHESPDSVIDELRRIVRRTGRGQRNPGPRRSDELDAGSGTPSIRIPKRSGDSARNLCILKLRATGLSFRVLSERCALSASQICRIVNTARRRLHRVSCGGTR